MSHRQIVGLKWARALDSRPKHIPIGRPRGAKRQGVKYERDFADVLPLTAWHGKWFEFLDVNGPGVCQPDFLLRIGDSIVILETKYTWTPVGHSQIAELYAPVVEMAYGLKTVGVVVCKSLTPFAPKSVSRLDEAIRLALIGTKPVVLHWLTGPLMTDLHTRHVAGLGLPAIGSL